MSTQSLKKQIKLLKQEKGILSRKIGEAKKSGEDTAPIIQAVQQLSEKIKALETQFKDHQKTKKTEAKDTRHHAIASQFLPIQLEQKPAQPLNVSLHHDGDSWDQFVQQHPNATIYHSWTIKIVIEHSFHHNTYYLSAMDEDQTIQGVLPLIELKSPLFGHSLVAVPFFNYGGLLANSDAARKQLLEAAAHQAKSLGVEHIEYRDCRKFDDMPVKEAKVTMLLNLPDTSEQLWKDLGTKLRAQIKKAERNQLQSKIGRKELLNDFYRVFARNMRDLGTPVYAKNFFANMLEYNPSARIVVIYHAGNPVSTGFILGWRNTMEIPWASTIRPANKLDANMKLYWEILKFSVSQGYQNFDFGRSSIDANTYKFKKQWGAKPHPLYWHYWLPNHQPLPEINPDNPKYKLMIWGWKKLPVWLANIIGPPIVKNLP